MSIWFASPTIPELAQMKPGTMMEAIDIDVSEIGNDYIVGSIPVNERTFQPMKFLHGGASIALAETLGSLAAFLTVDPNKYHVFGQSLNATHIKPVQSGRVNGKATPVHMGKKTQIWNIDIFDEEEDLIHNSRLTVRIVKKKTI